MFSSRENKMPDIASVTSFDLQRMMAQVVVRYTQCLKDIQQYEEAMVICLLRDVIDPDPQDSTQQPHYLIVLNDPVIADYLLRFFLARNVMSAPVNEHAIAVYKSTLTAARLTSKDEDEFLEFLDLGLAGLRTAHQMSTEQPGASFSFAARP